jgi:tetratricopeptide (TPR) repeat protein
MRFSPKIMENRHSLPKSSMLGLTDLEQATLVPVAASSSTSPLSPEERKCLMAEAHQWLKQGIAEYRQGQYTPALALLQQSLQAYRSLSHQSGEGKVLLTIASLYYQLADYLWAMDYARQSLAIAQKTR